MDLDEHICSVEQALLPLISVLEANSASEQVQGPEAGHRSVMLTIEQVPLLDRAQLYSTAAYALAALVGMHGCLSEGVMYDELVPVTSRIRRHMDRIGTRTSGVRDTGRVDVKAAQRIIRHDLGRPRKR